MSADGRKLFVGCAGANRVLVVDAVGAAVAGTIRLNGPPSGLALTADDARLIVTCAAPESTVSVIDIATGKALATLRAGHTAQAPVLSRDGRTLYVCNRFNNDVSVISLPARREICRIPVAREPMAAALTPDGKRLVVANHLPVGRADVEPVAADVTVIDTVARRVVKHIPLLRGSGLAHGVAISPDGRFAAVTHILARYYAPTTELEFGSMNSNALTLLDLNRLECFHTIRLDNAGQGAANPWAVAWTSDSKTIVVTLAGTHEVVLVDAPALVRRQIGLRKRVALPGNGPRALVVAGSRAFVANYFSDNLALIDLTASYPTAEPLELAPPHEPSLARKGEALFNDATLCFQGWQSCASCHSFDARADGLNWDLLNDGVGNPKNTRSLLLSHRRGPVMSLGVRDSAGTAVRAGIRHILFTAQPEEVSAAIDAYLQSLKPVPSPLLLNGHLSKSAQRGRQVFAHAGCAECHLSDLFTDRQAYDVDTSGPADKPSDRFYTPTLIEVWRTAPYLHDGSAATLRDVMTARNLHDQHGLTSNLSRREIEDLCAYVLSL